MPASAGAPEVLQALAEKGVVPSYFVNLSRSSLALLLKGRAA
jgi:hypothetical protein